VFAGGAVDVLTHNGPALLLRKPSELPHLIFCVLSFIRVLTLAYSATVISGMTPSPRCLGHTVPQIGRFGSHRFSGVKLYANQSVAIDPLLVQQRRRACRGRGRSPLTDTIMGQMRLSSAKQFLVR
jgi:hypothetical protein